jgi:hypothetical protein
MRYPSAGIELHPSGDVAIVWYLGPLSALVLIVGAHGGGACWTLAGRVLRWIQPGRA